MRSWTMRRRRRPSSAVAGRVADVHSGVVGDVSVDDALQITVEAGPPRAIGSRAQSWEARRQYLLDVVVQADLCRPVHCRPCSGKKLAEADARCTQTLAQCEGTHTNADDAAGARVRRWRVWDR